MSADAPQRCGVSADFVTGCFGGEHRVRYGIAAARKRNVVFGRRGVKEICHFWEVNLSIQLCRWSV
jgi:hypothetical protein